jgi:deoxyribonuclease IV
MTKRIGVHLGTAGGASNAVERAREIGANTFQIFSSSPRMWRAPKVDPKQARADARAARRSSTWARW